MKFVQILIDENESIFGMLGKSNKIVDLTETSGGIFGSFIDLLNYSIKHSVEIEDLIEETVSGKNINNFYDYDTLATFPLVDGKPRLTLAIRPSEVWAAGVTYKRSVDARKEESNVQDVYDRVYVSERPEIFFKATSKRIVGFGDNICLRSDSKNIVPESELGLVLGENAKIIGFIIGNDVTCRDIEGENPLYLPQAKIFNNSCSLGPVLAMKSALHNPYDLDMKCTITRFGKIVYSDSSNTSLLQRTFEELAKFLVRDNKILPGTVLLTGTAIVPPDHFSLEADDIVEIEIEGLGKLVNKVGKDC